MNTSHAAAIIAAGTAFVAAPINPRPLRRNVCRRHDDASFIGCTDCAQEQAAAEQAEQERAEADIAARVRAALGMPGRSVVEGGEETARRVEMWSQHELNALFQRIGGTVTWRTVQRTSNAGPALWRCTWTATEITVTVTLPTIGSVEVFTDWCEEYGGRDLPLMQAIPDATLIRA